MESEQYQKNKPNTVRWFICNEILFHGTLLSENLQLLSLFLPLGG